MSGISDKQTDTAKAIRRYPVHFEIYIEVDGKVIARDIFDSTSLCSVETLLQKILDEIKAS